MPSIRSCSYCHKFITSSYSCLQDDNKTLITYVVENHYTEFEGVEYVQTFKQLKKKYEDSMNGSTVGEKPTLDRWVYSNRYAAWMLKFMKLFLKCKSDPWVYLIHKFTSSKS